MPWSSRRCRRILFVVIFCRTTRMGTAFELTEVRKDVESVWRPIHSNALGAYLTPPTDILPEWYYVVGFGGASQKFHHL